MVQMHQNIVGLDSAIFMQPKVWKASGHVDGFSATMIDNKDSKKRYRADVLLEEHQDKIQDKIEKSGASGLSISGKGPAIFALLKSRKEALRLKGKLRRFFRVYAVKTFSGIQEGQLWK